MDSRSTPPGRRGRFTTRLVGLPVAQSGGFDLANGNSGRCVDVPGSSTVSGTRLQQRGCGDGGEPQQQWTFAPSGAASGRYLIRSVVSGLCIANKDGSTAGDNPLVEETCSDVARMQWTFNQVSGPSPTPSPTPTGRARSNNADGFASTAGMGDATTTGGAAGATVTVSTYADLCNNHLQNVTGYGNYARGATRMVIENSYYDTVKDPYYPDAAAQLRRSGSIVVTSTGNRTTGGSAFTPSSFYSYTLDPAAQVPALLRTHAGPQADIGM